MSLDLAPPAPTTVDLGVLPSDLDGGLGWRAAIGLVVLATDQTMEHEFRALISLPGVAFYEFAGLQRRRDPARYVARDRAENRAKRRAHPAGPQA